METDLKQFTADSGFMAHFINAETLSQIRSWLAELLTAREYIAGLERQIARIPELEEKISRMEHSVRFYVESNCELIERVRHLESEAGKK